MIPADVSFKAYLGIPDLTFGAKRCGTRADNPDHMIAAVCISCGAPRLVLPMIFEERSPEEVVRRIRELDS